MTCRHWNWRWRVAATQKELDDVARIRWAVFGGELGLLSEQSAVSRREVTCVDTLDTTVHVLVYAGDEPVATMRVALPNAEVAANLGGKVGLEMEQRVDLSGLLRPGRVVAEPSRFCVLPKWRRSEAVTWLQAGMYAESRRRGVTHWIASANLETDSPEDARLAWWVAARRGWLSPHWRVSVSEPSRAPGQARSPFYTPEERALAARGQWEGLRLPRAPALFARTMGARFIAEPLYDAYFQWFTLPLVMALDEIPTDSLARFHALEHGVSLAA
ncbi:GNAT family N-acetyltransferase [Myxococcus sp. K38C18041901]|uniref:N-acyl amino acid synthase FeeM domain-containing protein n=1 Tax=Myxococcus guangdongensis TaxID=2906760 RepID=UPI0020A77838|nr:GNAT family N-acyltransferase [Myxococcus guangdongensis]MCP3061494.1 GNAT family N-acetyltransferase [Myxococcus guangdongensis]